MRDQSWSAVKDRFEQGTLPDIHVLDTTRDDWGRFVNYIAASSYSPIMEKGEKRTEIILPADFPGDSEMPRLRFTVAGLRCNCFFWRDTRIEFDIDAQEIIGEEQFNTFISFLSDVRTLLGKDVVLTEENASFCDALYPILKRDGKLTDENLPADVIVWIPAVRGEAHG